MVNLQPGQAVKVTLVTQQEEGFEGEVVFAADGLPGGVQILPGAEVEPDQEPPLPEIHKERFVPKNQKTTVLLVAGGRGGLDQNAKKGPTQCPSRGQGQGGR